MTVSFRRQRHIHVRVKVVPYILRIATTTHLHKIKLANAESQNVCGHLGRGRKADRFFSAGEMRALDFWHLDARVHATRISQLYRSTADGRTRTCSVRWPMSESPNDPLSHRREDDHQIANWRLFLSRLDNSAGADMNITPLHGHARRYDIRC